MRERRDRKVLDEEGLGTSPTPENPAAVLVVNQVIGGINTLVPGAGSLLSKIDTAVKGGIAEDAERNRVASLTLQAQINAWEKDEAQSVPYGTNTPKPIVGGQTVQPSTSLLPERRTAPVPAPMPARHWYSFLVDFWQRVRA